MASSKILSTCLLVSGLANAAYNLNPEAYSSSDIITTDVAVIGGGSSGTFAAVSLLDHNKSVVVVEKEPVLGGHANTYTDPQTGIKINYGVVVFNNRKVVTEYFARLNVPLTKLGLSGGSSEYVDFSSGRTVRGFAPPSQKAFAAALQKYSVQLAKYPSLQASFNMSYPVHPDLLLPFGEFVHKYSLPGLVYTAFQYNQGYVQLLNVSTIYMFKYLGAAEVQSFGEGFLTTAHHDTGELYQNAATVLGQNTLLSSYPIAMYRSSKRVPVKILVQTPNGRKLIVAKKLVSSIPPTVSNLHSFDLSSEEKALFGQFYANGYYTAILNNTGLPPNIMLNAVDDSRPHGVPKLPGPYGFSPAPGTNLTHVYYASPTPLPEAHVRADILRILARVQKARGIHRTKAEYVAFANHAPFNLMVSNAAIKGGFYAQLDSLQGRRNTFYTGAAWQAQDSTALWQFTKHQMLPPLLAGL